MAVPERRRTDSLPEMIFWQRGRESERARVGEGARKEKAPERERRDGPPVQRGRQSCDRKVNSVIPYRKRKTDACAYYPIVSSKSTAKTAAAAS